MVFVALELGRVEFSGSRRTSKECFRVLLLHAPVYCEAKNLWCVFDSAVDPSNLCPTMDGTYDSPRFVP